MKTIINNKMKKNGFAPVLILIVIAVLGVVGYFAYRNYMASPSTPIQIYDSTPSSEIVSQDSDLISFVRSKLDLSAEADIDIEINEGNYVYGTAGEPDGGGFYWAAAKTNNQWSYVMGGNGIPSCTDVEIFPLGTFNGKFDSCYKGSEFVERK